MSWITDVKYIVGIFHLPKETYLKFITNQHIMGTHIEVSLTLHIVIQCAFLDIRQCASHRKLQFLRFVDILLGFSGYLVRSVQIKIKLEGKINTS